MAQFIKVTKKVDNESVICNTDNIESFENLLTGCRVKFVSGNVALVKENPEDILKAVNKPIYEVEHEDIEDIDAEINNEEE